ncbi:helix-turn-helix domain-containing protein [Streptomyces sp. MK5]|uniref:helix-turn-helix domain-containing protein n=1 Tax=Streptomyces sp. MK5 TaxID=3064253 RepID=UPI0027423837|nr:helix-turn-helix transcriptional regulator [Streptomyces sp. MK5]
MQRTTDPLWNSSRVRSLVARCDPGGLIRLGRMCRGWRQADLGRRLGCSASTVSRLERPGRVSDLRLLQRAAYEVGVPSDVLGAALGLVGPQATKVAPNGPHHTEEDPMRRRTLLAAAGLAVPASVLLGVESALAEMPAPSGSPMPIDVRLARARALFETGEYSGLLKALPDLLSTAHDRIRDRAEIDYARLSACYSLAAQVLVKIGRYDQARLTADRASLYADLSGSPLASAAAARELSIVLRHQDQAGTAQRLVLNAASRVEATGLKTEAQAAAYAQLLCTTSYTAACANDRDQAQSMIREAARASRDLPAVAPSGRLFGITPASVSLYQVGVHWALGDAGAAIKAGLRLHQDQFSTAERRARLHTDMARAWWQWGMAEQTAQSLLNAFRVAPTEVRDRPSMRAIVTELHRSHPRVSGVRELARAVVAE